MQAKIIQWKKNKSAYKKNRLVYLVEKDKLLIFVCLGHYN